MTEAIKISNLTLSYAKKNVIEHLHASILSEKVTTIIGPNGAGKSTLLKSIGKLLKKDTGEIFLYDQNIKDLSIKKLAQKVSILLQQNLCPSDITVEDLIYMGRFPHKKWYEQKSAEDKRVVVSAMSSTNILDFKKKKLHELSGGERQRVWLSMAICQQPKVLLLDEPTTFLDISYQLEILSTICQLNKETKLTVIMVLHDLNHAIQFSDQLIVLKNGKIVTTGKPNDIITHQLLKDIYNIEAKLIEIDQKPYIIPTHKWR